MHVSEKLDSKIIFSIICDLNKVNKIKMKNNSIEFFSINCNIIRVNKLALLPI